MKELNNQELLDVQAGELYETLKDIDSIDVSQLEIAEVEIDTGVRMTTHRS